MIVMNTIPDSFTDKFGKNIVLNSIDDHDIHSTDYMSWHLINRACEASNLAFAKAGHAELRVEGAYLPGYEPRAFAYWSTDTPRNYVIACTKGTGEIIQQTLIDAEFRSLLPPTSLALTKLHFDDLTALATSLTLATILYHEVAHVMRFHLPYLTERKEVEATSLPKLRGLCEADADKWCSYLIAPDLLAQAIGIREALKLSVPVEDVLHEVLTLYGVALHLWFAFFNQKTFALSSIYPHPLIRSTRITIGAADNIPLEKDNIQCALGRAANVLDGLTAVEEISLRTDESRQHPFDLAKELNAINTRFGDIERVLDPALRDVRSRWGAPGAA